MLALIRAIPEFFNDRWLRPADIQLKSVKIAPKAITGPVYTHHRKQLEKKTIGVICIVVDDIHSQGVPGKKIHDGFSRRIFKRIFVLLSFKCFLAHQEAEHYQMSQRIFRIEISDCRNLFLVHESRYSDIRAPFHLCSFVFCEFEILGTKNRIPYFRYPVHV